MCKKKQEKNKKTLGAPPIAHQDVNEDVNQYVQEETREEQEDARGASKTRIELE